MRLLALVTKLFVCCHSFPQTAAKPKTPSTSSRSVKASRPQPLATPAQSAEPPSQPPPLYSEAVFDGIINPGYMGNDLEKLYADLSQKYAPKGEYETTVQYQQRLDSARLTNIVGSIPSGGPYAFVFNLKEIPIYLRQTKYDADAGVMTLTRDPQVKPDTSSDYKRGTFLWMTKVLLSKDVEATNGFGAHFIVHDTMLENYGIAFDARNKSPYSLSYEIYDPPKPLVLNFSVSPAEAPALIERLRLLVVCTPQAPSPTTTGLDGYSATIRNPSSNVTEWKYLNVNLVRYALFDDTTGNVLVNQGLTSDIDCT